LGQLLQRRGGRSGSTTPGSTTFPTSTRRGRPAPHFDYRLGIDPDNPFTTLGINIQAAADISDESNGWLVQPSLDYINRLSLQWLFNARLFSTYADENYMQEYLDVSGNQGCSVLPHVTRYEMA
jgi:hypothetical protein